MRSNPICIKCAAVAAERGDLEGGMRQIDRACDLAEQFGAQDLLQRVWVDVLRGHCHFVAGNMRAAIDCFDAASGMRRARHFDDDFVTVRAHPMMVRACLDLARNVSGPERRALLRKAKLAARRGLHLTKRFQHVRPPAFLAAACYEWTAGHRRRARDLFDRSIALATAQDSKITLADAHFELGVRLRESSDSDHTGREHLQTAFDLYTACEAAPYVARVRKVMASPRS